MKKLLLPLVFIFFGTVSVFAQPTSNFVFFSEDGQPFSLVMNGIQENDNPQTNVRVTGLTATAYKVRIVFEDKTIPTLEKNVYTKPGIEITYVIKKHKKGYNVLRYYSEAPVSYEDVVTYDDNPIVIRENVNVQDNNSGGIHIDVNVNESGINYNVDTPEGSINVNANIDINSADVNYSESYTENETHYVMPGYTGSVGCPWPMKPQDFYRAKQSIENADFSSDKQTIAKQIISSNCLTAEQVKQIVSLFDFESGKLEFAKFAYTYTYDVGDYFIINDAFDFSSSIEELDEYINSVSR